MVISNGNTGQATEFPDHFVSYKEKQKETWIQKAMDHYAAIALMQYSANDKLRKNLDLMQGEFDFADFIGDPEVESVADKLAQDVDIPTHLQHFSILNAPINTILGELRARPDRHRLYAYDEESIAENKEAKSQMLQQMAMGKIRERVYQSVMQVAAQQAEQLQAQAESSQDPAEQQAILQQIQQIQADAEQQAEQQLMSMPQIEEYMVKTFENAGEQWGNKRLKYMKRHFLLKENGLTAMEHYLATGKYFLHGYLSNSPVGFDMEVLSPHTVFHSMPVEINYDGKSTQDFEYIGFGRFQDVSSLIERWKLDEKEIDQLKEDLKQTQSGYFQVNYAPNNRTGSNSIDYQTKDWAGEQLTRERMFANAWDKPKRGYRNYANANFSAYTQEIFVVQVYFKSKRKIGKLTYVDANGLPQVDIVDETYQFSAVDGDINIEWEWINQWWQGTKIGLHIYKDVKPLEFQAHKPFNYKPFCPIVGFVDNKAFIDYAKPMQIGFNICMNQIFDLLEKEIGPVALANLRHLPNYKDWGGDEALDKAIITAKEVGILPTDDDPKNLQGQSSFSYWQTMDLTRAGQIRSRIELAQFFKNECMVQLGFSLQRLGEITPSETAQGIETARSQSYTQTMRYFVKMDLGMIRFYELLLNIAMYVETFLGKTTLSYLASDMDSAFLRLNAGRQLLTELGIELTSSPDEEKITQALLALTQPMLQNGADPLDIAKLQTSDSVSQMIDVLEVSRKRLEKKQQEEMQMRQQELEQQKQIEADRLAYVREKDKEDRKTQIEVAQIRAMGFAKNPDIDANNVPDVLEFEKFNAAQQAAQQKLLLEKQKIATNQQKTGMDFIVDQQKLQVEREKMATQERIAEKNRNQYDTVKK